MNTVESIFKTETTVTGLVEIFKTALCDVADLLNYPSCISFSLIETE